MIDATIAVYGNSIKKRLGSLEKKAALVMARAANRAATTGKKVIKQETARKYMVKQGDVESVLKVSRASQRHPLVKLEFKDNHKNLFYWSKRGSGSVVTPNVPVIYDGDGTPLPKVYKAKVERQHGVKVLGGSRKPFVQIARKSGNMALFRRTSDTSREIEGVAAPALPQIIGNNEVLERFEQETSKMLFSRLEHEIKYELGKGM